jgi:N-acetyl-anhydromuramyl-L-alanine amidase AmpD
MRYIDKIIIHCSATYNHMDVGVEWIDAIHKSFGWSGVGYHFIVCRDGTIQKGRHIDVVGAHAKHYNTSSIGICWIGGLSDEDKPEDNRTHFQKAALRTLIETLIAIYPDAEILGHRDLPNVKKACPCFDVKKWYYEQRPPSLGVFQSS